MVFCTAPTLPAKPSSAPAIGLATARQADPDIGKGGGNWSMRFMNRHPNALHLWEAVEHGCGDGAGGSFHQPIAAAAERLTGDGGDLIVAHGMRQLVRARCVRKGDVEEEVEGESLAHPGRVVHHGLGG